MSGQLVAPDYMRAFLKVPRSVLRELLPRPDELVTYLAIYERAAYTAGPRLLKHHGVVHLEIGECVFGRKEIALACSTSEQRVRTAISNLRKLGFLTIESTKLGTKATIAGYGGNADGDSLEQPSNQPRINQPSNQESTNDQPAEQPLTRKKEGEEGKKEKKGKKISASNVHRLFDFWKSKYEAKRGSTYGPIPADWKALKEIDGALPVEEIESRMTNAFEAPPAFPPQPWSIRTFVNNHNACAKPTEARAAAKAAPMPTEADYAALPDFLKPDRGAA